MVVLLNRGDRTWDLHDAVEKDGKLSRRARRTDGTLDEKDKVVKRKLGPGQSIEALDQAEADQLLAHTREIVDADKVMPQVADKMKSLNDKLTALEAELAESKVRLAKYETGESKDDEKFQKEQEAHDKGNKKK